VASRANPSIGIQTLAGRFGVHFYGWIPFASFAVLIHKTITGYDIEVGIQVLFGEHKD